MLDDCNYVLYIINIKNKGDTEMETAKLKKEILKKHRAEILKVKNGIYILNQIIMNNDYDDLMYFKRSCERGYKF